MIPIRKICFCKKSIAKAVGCISLNCCCFWEGKNQTAQVWNGWCWHLGLASVAINGAIATFGNCALAQSNITRDGTLGTESSIVSPNFNGTPNEVITGGAQRGANLFHSFLEFNVSEGRAAYFSSPNAAIKNIIARVTGGNRSEILGLIGTLSNSNPNLFLINPNGIIFGPNAILNVGGSFVASTASSLNFNDGNQFSATAQPTTSLLSVNVPVGLQFGQTPGSMVVQAADLVVSPGKTLAIAGGNLNLEGGSLQTNGGRIDLGKVTGSGTVGLLVDGDSLRLSYPAGVQKADLLISNQALVNASGDRGGDIQVQGRRITLTDNSIIYADTISQNGGEISIHASELIVNDGSQISASSLGAGQGGTLTVNASDSVQLSGTTSDGQFLSSLFAQSEDIGNAGSLTINTRKLIIEDGAQVSAGTSAGSTGQGGTLTVNASDSVQLSRAVETPVAQFTSGLYAQTQGSGNAGNLTINTGKLIAQDGGQVSAGAGVGSQGNGGTLTVNATDSIELSGTAPNAQDTSGLFARTRGSGAAGELTVTTGRLTVRDKAQLTVSSLQSGERAGNLEVTANSISLDNEGAIIADTASAEGGNITLNDLNLLLLRNSRISTSAGIDSAGGNGGNINIDTNLLIALENSEIKADAFTGNGGNIQINTQGIFLSPDSSITASSERGINGVVEINTPDIQPSQGFANLPEATLPVGLLAQGCPTTGGQSGSRFINTGRGGKPPTPSEVLGSYAVWEDLRPSSLDVESSSDSAAMQQASTSPAPLVEAQGWVIGDKGKVVLTAQASSVTPHIPWLQPNRCNAS